MIIININITNCLIFFIKSLLNIKKFKLYIYVFQNPIIIVSFDAILMVNLIHQNLKKF